MPLIRIETTVCTGEGEGESVAGGTATALRSESYRTRRVLECAMIGPGDAAHPVSERSP